LPERSQLTHSSADSRMILWVGSFDHRVNLEGVDLFLRRAWGSIRNANPGACFRIVGSGLSDKIRRRWAGIAGVEVIGFAPSLAEHYAEAAFTIVPLLDGAGTKIKVLESLGYLRTSVVTRHALSGFEFLLHEGEAVRVVDSLEELVVPATELLRNPTLRHELEARGREIVDGHFTPVAVGRAVRGSVARLMEVEAAGRV
jgi:glycosyltransferase involved in cell wall biosynthesis